MTNFKNSGMLLSEWIKMNQANQERLSNRSAASSLNSNCYPKGTNCRSIDNIQRNSPQKQFPNHLANDYPASHDTSSVKSAQSMPSVYVRKMRLDGFDSNAHTKQDNQKINKTATIAPANPNYKAVAAQNQWYKMTKKQNGVKIDQVTNEKPLVLPVVVKQSSEDRCSSRTMHTNGEDKIRISQIEQRVSEKPLILPAVVKQSSEDIGSSRGSDIINESKKGNLLVESKSKSIDSAKKRHLVMHEKVVVASDSELKDKNVTIAVESKTDDNFDEIIITETKTETKSEQSKPEELKKELIVVNKLQNDTMEKVLVIQENIHKANNNINEQNKTAEIQNINTKEHFQSFEDNKNQIKETLKSSESKAENLNNMKNQETISKINAQLQTVNREKENIQRNVEKQNKDSEISIVKKVKESESSSKKHSQKSHGVQNKQSEKSEEQISAEKNQKSNEISQLKNETNPTLQNASKNPESMDEMNELINKLDKVVEDNLNNIKSNEYDKFDKTDDKSELLEKILSTEFQASVDKFLNSNDYQNSFLNNLKNLAK